MNAIYADSLRDREEERQMFIQEIAELNLKMEEKERLYENRIQEIENDNQHSLDQKISEFWNSAQDNEQKLIKELQDLDDRLKIAERNNVFLKNEIENKIYSFEKEKNELLLIENQMRLKIKEKEINEAQIIEEKKELKQKIKSLLDEINERTQENISMKNQMTEILKNNITLKNQIIENDVKIHRISELYENSNSFIRKDLLVVHKDSNLRMSQVSPPLAKNAKLTDSICLNCHANEKKIENETKLRTLTLLSPPKRTKSRKMTDSSCIKKEKTNEFHNITDSSGLKEDDNKFKTEGTKEFSKSPQILENKETVSISNFDDLESNVESEEDMGIEPSPEYKVSKLSVNEKNDSIKKENIKILERNQQIMEKNELLLLFLKEKEEDLFKMEEKMKNLLNINVDYENEIKELRAELKTALEIRTSSFAERNNINVMNDAKDLKILELESDLVEAKEKWGNLVNFLNEELNLAEKAAVQAKVKYVEEASQKEFFQFKYNDLLCKLKKGNLKKKN